MKIYNIYEEIEFENQEKIFIKTDSEKNMLELARKDNIIKNRYKNMLKEDYILYLHKEGVSRFCKRTEAYKLFSQEHNFSKSNNILYRLEKPIKRKINNKTSKKLLVIFSKMPGIKHYDSAKIPHRMIPPFFKDIGRSIVKNTYIMRIMDLNVSHGSHYVNTINYPNYEDEIGKAIQQVMDENNIMKKHVVFFGVSRGGAGAIYNGSKLDFKTVAVDPILNIGDKLLFNDRRMLNGLRQEDLVPNINQFLLKSNVYSKHIICSENVPLYYEQIQRLNKKVNIMNIVDDNITQHAEVSPNSVPEQLMLINNLFLMK